jgi:4-hydroxy-tetrahydrodipicolinate synthase
LGNWAYAEALLAAHAGQLAILIGDERQLAQAVRLGGQGAISGLANLCPAALLPLAEEGREDARIAQFVDAICGQPVIPAIKALVAARTGDPAWTAVRPPLLPAQDIGSLLPLLDGMLARQAGTA